MVEFFNKAIGIEVNHIIPKPFSQINFLLGEAFKITELTTEEAKISIKKAMENVKI